ncbi:MAG: hypothetical protein IPL83_08655 [Bdellovibrionales bacterium]|nr:hypothetical protein [Bdellovibrionales bacterium]
MKKDEKGEKGIDRIYRRLNMLMMLSRKNQELTTLEIAKNCGRRVTILLIDRATCSDTTGASWASGNGQRG